MVTQRKVNKHCFDCYDFPAPKSRDQSPLNISKSSQKRKKVTYSNDIEEVDILENRPFQPNMNINNKVKVQNNQPLIKRKMKNSENTSMNKNSIVNYQD